MGGIVTAAVTSMLIATGTAAPGGPAAAGQDGSAECDSVTTCYTPQQIQVAYGLRQLLDQGFDGRGETVVLPEFAEQQLSPPMVTDIRQDLAGFDRRFHLPGARLEITTRLARGASRWLSYEEETLDVEIVHAVAPAAAISVILLPFAATESTAGMTAAVTDTVRMASSLGDVVSFSEGVGEHCFTSAEVATMHAALQRAARDGVTVVAGSGDTGPVGVACPSPYLMPGVVPVIEPVLPAADPLVLAVGGTSLAASHRTGDYISETGWDVPFQNIGVDTFASGGGFSRVFPRPAYQDGVRGIGDARAIPDVAADASGHTGMALVISGGHGQYSISGAAGTSAAAPFWAALIAVADQYAGHDLGLVNPVLYCLARGRDYPRAFHDVTQGDSTVVVAPDTITGYQAGPGWDAVTGWGSPDAQVLVPLLARGTSMRLPAWPAGSRACSPLRRPRPRPADGPHPRPADGPRPRPADGAHAPGHL